MFLENLGNNKVKVHSLSYDFQDNKPIDRKIVENVFDFSKRKWFNYDNNGKFYFYNLKIISMSFYLIIIINFIF